MSDIENEFDGAVAQINDKIKQAAEALKEANEIGKKAGIEYLGASYYTMEDLSKEDLKKMRDIDFEPLLDQLDEAGWHSSSLKC